MQTPDYIVLVGYFGLMIVIGILCAWRVKQQEDFFMGGRSFGKLLQTFAAFGAGTGAQDPINVGRTTWTSGLSGIWSALMWLFITPFYWIFAVWYRRMRHLTLGDWFVERYESQPLGVAYTAFAFTFYIFYLSTMFSAIGKVAAPLLGSEATLWLTGLIGSTNPADLKYTLVPLVAVVVIIYGVLGGLSAAYWTDLIQGLCIIVLSIILIPTGLAGLVERFGDPATMSWTDGFHILHQRLTPDNFQLFGGPRAGEFPLHYIVSLSLLGLMGIVVQPHFIATGGGSAKTERSARIGLVTGNFLKRLCTIGWALTGLIVLALLADNLEIGADPDQAWGVASREILGKWKLGLVGLMLACLFAALMSSADCNMLVAAALLVRNVYAPYIHPDASEKVYVNVGRVAGLIMIAGASAVSLIFYDVFAQYVMALELATVFAAPFWVGMYWRRATRTAAWGTILISLAVFFVIPSVAPRLMPSLRTNPALAITSNVVTTKITRQASAADVAKREAAIVFWNNANQQLHQAWSDYQAAQKAANETAQVNAADGLAIPSSAALAKVHATLDRLVFAKAAREKLLPEPVPIEVGDPFTDTIKTGGKGIFFTKVVPLSDQPAEEISRVEQDDTTVVTERFRGPARGEGPLNLDFMLYSAVGMDLRGYDDAMLTTLRLPPRLVTPFLLMIVLSLLTRPGSQQALDRYYVKMKTPVQPDHADDQRELEESYRNPTRFDHRKLFPGTSLEIQKPTRDDLLGFVVSIGVCFAFLTLAWWLANIGGSFSGRH